MHEVRQRLALGSALTYVMDVAVFSIVPLGVGDGGDYGHGTGQGWSRSPRPVDSSAGPIETGNGPGTFNYSLVCARLHSLPFRVHYM